MIEEPTQRIYTHRGDRAGHAADAPTTAMPGPLNLAGAAEPDTAHSDASATNVLSLDELFETDTTADSPAPPTAQEAPTWTAMPVVPVRSEPLSPPPAPTPPAAPARTAPGMGDRLRSDAAAAWHETVRRTRAWLAHGDNGLMLLTALVAVILIMAVAAFSA